MAWRWLTMADHARPDELVIDSNLTPFVVTWETTRASAPTPRYSPGVPMPRRDPRELTTAEGRQLIDDLVRLGGPQLTLTGGDPFIRPDLTELTRYATQRGLRVSLSLSATAFATREALEELQQADISTVQLSLDGLEAAHDAFHGIAGSYKRTLELIGDVQALGLP